MAGMCSHQVVCSLPANIPSCTFKSRFSFNGISFGVIHGNKGLFDSQTKCKLLNYGRNVLYTIVA